MQLELNYNSGRLKLEIDERVTVDSFQPLKSAQSISFSDFKSEFENSEAYSYLSSSSSLLFVLNDGHRNTPSSVVLDWINQIDSSII